MNTYFVFWKKVDGEITELKGRSVRASDVSISDGKLKFWREVGNTAGDNLVFSLPVEVLVDFHKVEPMPETKPAGQPPKIDCDFVNWAKSDSDLSQKVAELALKVEDIKRQKALDEREKELTFSLFELNEQRLNDEAMERKVKASSKLYKGVSVDDTNGMSTFLAQMEKADIGYKASLGKPYMDHGFFSDYKMRQEEYRLVNRLEAIREAIDYRISEQNRLLHLLLENICRLTLHNLKAWLEFEEYKDKSSPHICIEGYLKEWERVNYGFSYTQCTPRELIARFFWGLEAIDKGKLSAFGRIEMVCKEIRESGKPTGNFGNEQRSIVENKYLLAKKRLILSFLTNIVKGFDND